MAKRATKFTRQIADKVIAGLKQGTPLTVICRPDDMPCDETVRNWGKADEQFALDIAHAREVGFDALAAECLDIAEDGSRDYTKRENEDGSEYEVFNSEHVQRSKLRIETRLKLLSKWDPKRYGDKQQVEHSGGVTVAASAHDETL